jgi:ABC-type transport system involved in cytochrome bd biosynthesis fused ATPase/permease subunit
MDLMSLVLDIDALTRRALRLLIPLLLGFVAVVAIFTTWALQPSHVTTIAAIFAACFPAPDHLDCEEHRPDPQVTAHPDTR